MMNTTKYVLARATLNQCCVKVLPQYKSTKTMNGLNQGNILQTYQIRTLPSFQENDMKSAHLLKSVSARDCLRKKEEIKNSLPTSDKPINNHYKTFSTSSLVSTIPSSHHSPSTPVEVPSDLPFWLDGKNMQALDIVKSHVQVLPSFITEEEEQSLMSEIEPRVKRLRYEYDHWDDAIHGFREIERVKWNTMNSEVLERVRQRAFAAESEQLPHVHVLDLAQTGYIKPHIDSVRYCGDTITGLSLLTDSVIRFVHETDKELVADVLLPRRSLYIVRGEVRYKFTHEILSEAESAFRGEAVPKGRRVSVICRNSAAEESTETE